MFDYKIILYLFFGILPSTVWLMYYLGKDLHPEPKKTILRIFFWGALSTIPVFFLQLGLVDVLLRFDLPPIWNSIINWFFIIAVTEELFKYLVVRLKMGSSPDLDEPLDIMLYMVVSALGFAALENVLYLFTPIAEGATFEQVIHSAISITVIRFLGATFLHTLSSAIIGYFMALSVYYYRIRHIVFLAGFFLAVLLHGTFNFLIMEIKDYESLKNIGITIGIILLTVGFLTFIGFEKLKNMKSVSKII